MEIRQDVRQAAAAAPSGTEAIAWVRRDGLEGLVARNAALLVCTLGIHRFWGNAAWRRHVWSRIVLRGDPLEFTGTGLEAFRGFLIFVACFAPVFAALDLLRVFAAQAGIAAVLLAKAAYAAAFLALLAVARLLRWRYLLSRTRWRGVALALDAPLAAYLRLHAGLQALNALTLFLATPWVSLRLHAWMLSRVRLGAARLACAPDWRPLILPWLGVWICAALVLGACATWALDGLRRAGLLASHLPLPQGVAPGWIPALALAAAAVFFAAYRIALWRALAAASQLGAARLSSAARPGFAARRVALAGLVFLGGVAVGLACVGALLMPVPRGAVTLRWIGWGGLGGLAAATAFALARDAFFRPAVMGHFVSTLELAEGEALDAIAAPAAGRAEARGGEPLDAGFG